MTDFINFIDFKELGSWIISMYIFYLIGKLGLEESKLRGFKRKEDSKNDN